MLTPLRFMVVAMLGILAAGCSEQTELKAAKERIAQLEAELAAEKAKSQMPTAPQTEKPAAVQKLSEPEPTPAPIVEPEPTSTGQQWVYDANEDKMTGGTTYSAYALSTNTVSFDRPYSGDQHGRLVLRTDPKYGRDVMFSIERGQLLCRSYSDCEVLVRFDENKPEKFSGVGPADSSTETVFIRNYDRFVSRMRKAKTVRISVNIYQEGSPVFEFDVSGFNSAKYAGKE